MDISLFSKLINNTEEELKGIKSLNSPDAELLYEDLMPIIKDFKDGGLKLLEEGDVLQIGIVGQVKAGKSSFLNSLFFDGESILPKASTPMTAGLTVLEYNEKNTFEVDYFTKEDWDVFVTQDEAYKRVESEVKAHESGAPASIINRMIEERTTDEQRSAHEMVSSCSTSAKSKIGGQPDCKKFEDKNDLQDILEQYVGAKGEYTSVVKSLYIKMNDTRLKGIRIVDTPGVNDPVVSRENRTRMFLHSCHGVFLLSASTDFLGSGDVNFLNNRIGSQGIGCVLLLASKFDSVLQDLGAECEMKGISRGDLAEVQDNQVKRLKKRLREQQETIKGDIKIKVDFTAGIGYSIAHKPSSKWDEIEQNVVKQMRRYYPEYFETEADVKETFEALSNISDIREKYLEGWFMSNKDEIISQKINEYFSKNENEIKSKLRKKAEELEAKQKQVSETTLAEIQHQKEVQGKVFKQLDDKFRSIFTKFGTTLQTDIRGIENSIEQPSVYKIPTETTLGTVEYKGALWGHNSDTFEYTIVDTNALYEILRSAINGYADDFNQKWKSLFDKARNDMAAKLYDEIANFEMELDSTSSFDDKYYRNLIESTIDSMRLQQELRVKPIKDEAERACHNICSKRFYPGNCAYDYKESAVPSILAQESDKFIANIRRESSNHIAIYTERINQCIEENMKNALTSIDKMKKEFGPRLQEEGAKYMAELELKLKDKEKSLNELKLVVDAANRVYNIFK